MRTHALLLVAGLFSFAAGCSSDPPPPADAPPQAPPAPPPSREVAKGPVLDKLARAEFNLLAARVALPVFWIADANDNRAIDPEELAVLWGIADGGAPWVEKDAFTQRFLAAYEAMLGAKDKGAVGRDDNEAEKKRRAAVLAELDQARPALIRSDFRSAAAQDRAIVGHVLAAAKWIEQIYAKQRGSFGLEAGIAADDTASRMVFYRNQGPWCERAKTEKDPACNAVAALPAKIAGLYPAALQKDPKFCEKLDKRKDQAALLDPFTVVVSEGTALRAVPYTAVYKEEMTAIAGELAAAAQAITSPDEKPFKDYLTAAAQSFRDNDWKPADEAWAKMNVSNSKWYLRVGPDETYADPCSRKAGFHVSFARINQDSIAWQKKLDPLKTELEAELARLAGPPYKARNVTFRLPDFIEIIVNAGDSRSSAGATIGQSLPNWGPVAKEGRGRTVAMTNIGIDKDTRAALVSSVESVYCASAMAHYTPDPAPGLMGTVLHEAAHNLGPSSEYKVRNKKDDEIFGGPLASTFEELKAEVSANYFTDWLAAKGVIDKTLRDKGHVAEIAWAFGHIAEGLTTAEGKLKPYSQLAAIEMGHLLKSGVLRWKEKELAANGKDVGCFEIDLAAYPEAMAALEKVVLGIKARGDKPAAEQLRAEFADRDGPWKKLRGVIEERWRRMPKSTYVYSIQR